MYAINTRLHSPARQPLPSVSCHSAAAAQHRTCIRWSNRDKSLVNAEFDILYVYIYIIYNNITLNSSAVRTSSTLHQQHTRAFRLSVCQSRYHWVMQLHGTRRANRDESLVITYTYSQLQCIIIWSGAPTPTCIDQHTRSFLLPATAIM